MLLKYKRNIDDTSLNSKEITIRYDNISLNDYDDIISKDCHISNFNYSIDNYVNSRLGVITEVSIEITAKVKNDRIDSLFNRYNHYYINIKEFSDNYCISNIDVYNCMIHEINIECKDDKYSIISITFMSNDYKAIVFE